jgi:hypothetical protein
MSAYSTIDQIIDQHLQITDIGKAPHYKHKTSALKLSKGLLWVLMLRK